MKEIPLTQGKVALVDDEDYERVSQFKWHAAKRGQRFYGARNVRRGSSKTIQLLHHFVLAPRRLDHEDGDGLNNQKRNLRRLTHKDNLRAKCRKVPGVTSQYRGVCRNNRDNGWTAQITADAHKFSLGTYQNEGDAAIAYDWAARICFGDVAALNFPASSGT